MSLERHVGVRQVKLPWGVAGLVQEGGRVAGEQGENSGQEGTPKALIDGTNWLAEGGEDAGQF